MTQHDIEIFKAGKHTAMNGQMLELNEQQLADIARSYSVSTFRAPLVKGHPETNAPAYGWVDQLYTNGPVLMARVGKLEPSFAEEVRSGRYRKVSASFFMPSASNNPVKGTHYLRHVGVLGAASPAVTGLKEVSFSDDDDFLTFGDDDFSGYPTLIRRALLRNRHICFVEKMSKEGRVLPSEREPMLAFMAMLSNRDALNFGDGQTLGALDWFEEYVRQRQPVTEFGASEEEEPPTGNASDAFDMPDGFTADLEDMEAVAKIVEFAEKNNMSFEEAMRNHSAKILKD